MTTFHWVGPFQQSSFVNLIISHHEDVLKKKKSHTNDVFILTKVTLTLTFEERLVSERDVSTLGEKKDTG